MKKSFSFNEEIIICDEEKTSENESIISLSEELELNGWTVKKTIIHKFFPSAYKYNFNDYWKFTLTDCNEESRLITMNQTGYIDNQMSELSKRPEFISKDWSDFDTNTFIQLIENETKELHTNPNKIETIIKLAYEFKEKVLNR